MEKSSLITQLKKKIPFETKVQFQLQKLKCTSDDQNYFNFNSKEKRIFIFLAADYGNLGDVAITYAQHLFLSYTYPEYQVIEIPISRTLKGIVQLKKHIQDQDIVTTVGGGNTGDMYHQIEHFRQLVIQNFPNNPVISFPQTIDFSTTEKGRKRLQKAIAIYGKHPKLTLVARELKSYDYYKKYFNNKVLLLPDIVTTLDRSQPEFERSGAIICLRKDKERKLSEQQELELTNYVKERFNNYTYYDTHIGGQGLTMKKKIAALFQIWDTFKKTELVITDRLHGMIFCHITNTPALVFLNNNHKIEQSYKWIAHNPRLKLIKNYHVGDIATKINQLSQLPETDRISLMSAYKNFKTMVE
jgi:pyruvyl transferase EpsI